MFTNLTLFLVLSLVAPSFQTTFNDVLSANKNLSSFHDALTKYHPDLLTLIDSQPEHAITVLAPSNAAFAKTVYYPIIGPAFSNNDVSAIKAILEYHVVVGDHATTGLLPTFQYFPTWLSNSSFSNVTDGQRVGGVMQSGKEMFWVSGQSNRSPGIKTDISFASGTVHMIDSLMIPPTSFPQTSVLFSTASEPNQLTSFLGATYYSNTKSPPALAHLLNDTSDITIFAPNNVAMETVRASLTALTNSTDAFNKLLSYHIVVGQGGPWYSTKFNQTGTKVLKTLSGDSITISFSPNSFFVNGARLITSDLLINNGVMHVLDSVLSPDNADVKPNPSLATQLPALSTGGSFNVSAAPFTTFLPNTINTDVATQTAATYNGGRQTTTSSGAAATTASAKGEVGRSVPHAWLGVGSLAGGLVMWGGVAV